MRIALGIGWGVCVLAGAAAAQTERSLAVFNQGFEPARRAQQLEQRAASGASLRDSDFSGALLAGLALTGTDLTRTVWRKTDLRGARFTDCTLDQADLSGAYLGGAAFEGCRLRNAQLAGASMRGSYLRACDLSGANFEGADTAGTTLIGVTLSPTGAPYLPALRTAIELRGGAKYSPALVAAASGDAFDFTYNRTDRTAWPGTPMTFSPIQLALDTVGFDATYKTTIREPGGARKELAAVLRRGLVAIIPMRLAGAGLDGDSAEGPVWVAACGITGTTEPDEQVRLQTPFGPMTFGLDDLLRRWRGPWPTLLPAGETVSTAPFPLCTVGALKTEVSDQAVVVEALRHASAIMNESRTFGESRGGFQAYEALIQDVNDEQVVLGDVVHWSGGPRLALAASRGLAADFLRETAPKMPEPAQGSMREAAGLYDEIDRLLTEEWPVPNPNAFEGDTATIAVGAATERRPYAGAVLQAALERERRAMALLEQAVADSVRPAP